MNLRKRANKAKSLTKSIKVNIHFAKHDRNPQNAKYFCSRLHGYFSTRNNDFWKKDWYRRLKEHRNPIFDLKRQLETDMMLFCSVFTSAPHRLMLVWRPVPLPQLWILAVRYLLLPQTTFPVHILFRVKVHFGFPFCCLLAQPKRFYKWFFRCLFVHFFLS